MTNGVESKHFSHGQMYPIQTISTITICVKIFSKFVHVNIQLALYKISYEFVSQGILKESKEI